MLLSALVSTIIGLANCPNVTLLSENASITGRPEIKFAENIEPDISSVTENNLPLVPSTVNTLEPLPSTDREAVLAPTVELELIINRPDSIGIINLQCYC